MIKGSRLHPEVDMLIGFFKAGAFISS